MIKCETCIYRKNCQFLAKHRKAIVEDCTAFESEAELKNKTAKEIFDALDEYIKTWKAESVKRIQYDKTNYYQGKAVAADQIMNFIRTELKPKFMEEE